MNSSKALLSSNLDALLAGYRYGRYLEDQTLDPSASRRLVEDKIREYLGREETDCIVAEAGPGEVQGALLFKLSPWDTEHFGIKTAIVESALVKAADYETQGAVANRLLFEFQGWCGRRQIRFVFAKISSADLPVIHAFEKNGFGFMENWIFNKYELKNLDPQSRPPFELRLIRASDLDPMLSFAKGAFTTHRFHADSHIPWDKAEALYEKWILTAYHDPNQKILVYEDAGKPVAFMIYYPLDLRPYFNLQFAMWKMALTDPACKGRGIGKKFFISLLHYHRREGLDIVDSGVSQRNFISLNLHNALNFKIFCTLVTFHKWL